MDKIMSAFLKSDLGYLDAIETLQKECGMTGREAEALVETWSESLGDPVGGPTRP
jgi:hypothetical protein